MLNLNIPKRKSYDADFTTIVGDDIEVCVRGDYERNDPGVGYRGGYSITRVWLETDINATDIQTLLHKGQIDRIEEEGAEHMRQAEVDAKADYADNYR